MLGLKTNITWNGEAAESVTGAEATGGGQLTRISERGGVLGLIIEAAW